MAKSTMLVVFLVIAAVLAPLTSAAIVEATISPPPPEEYDHLDDCVHRLAPYCGDELFMGIFFNKAVSLLCCHNLILMGEHCNNDLVQSIVDMEHLTPNTQKVWKFCADAMGVESLALPPSSF